jgi:hypothetical protein
MPFEARTPLEMTDGPDQIPRESAGPLDSVIGGTGRGTGMPPGAGSEIEVPRAVGPDV